MIQNGLTIKSTTVVLLFLLASSCMKEKKYDCGATLRLSFSYTFNADGRERLREEVSRVHLYLFDRAGYLYSSTVLDVEEFDDSRSVVVDVDPGEYTAVAWGNLDSGSYTVSGLDASRENTRTAMSVRLITDPNGEVNSTAADLFHGMVAVSAVRTGDNRANVLLVRNTNDINVLLEPATGTRSAGEGPDVRITGTNGALDFENSTAATEPTIYLPDYSVTLYNGQAYDMARFKVMKLEIGDDTLLSIYLDGELNRRESLTGLIMQYFPHIVTDQDLARYSDYTFVYRYDTSSGIYILTSVSVEGWTESVERPGGI